MMLLHRDHELVMFQAKNKMHRLVVKRRRILEGDRLAYLKAIDKERDVWV